MPAWGRSYAGRTVEIETEWNLKYQSQRNQSSDHTVEIETEWNLKIDYPDVDSIRLWVEIETEWNLKLFQSPLLLK